MFKIAMEFKDAPTPQLIAAALRKQAELFDGIEIGNGKTETKSPKKTKAQDEDESFDLGDEVEETEDEDEEDTKAAKVKKPAKEIKLENVITAFKNFAEENSREKAAKVLAKFGVKSVRDLKPAQYKDVMAIVA